MERKRGDDIALGYSESSTAMKPAIAYTGRLAADPLDTMQPETVLFQGGGAQTGQNRWGDYSSMSVDPSDGCTFWYTNQYIPVDGNYNWQTQVGAFSFPSCVRRSDSDFSASLFPASATVAAPGSVATTVSTGRTAGAAQTVTLSTAGLPAGVSGSFSPNVVTAGPGPGSSSALTLTVGPGTSPGTYPITVDAAGSSTSHVATFTLTVPDAALSNGGFETGALTGWRTLVGSAAVNAGAARSGGYGAVLGASVPTNGDSSIAQSFTLTEPATLSFWYQLSCPDTVTYDWATVTLQDDTAGTPATLLPRTCVTSSPWTQVTTALGPSSVGHAFTLVLTSHDDDYTGDATFTKFDDVALVPSSTPDFSVSASPPSQTVVAGDGTSYSVATSTVGGFSGSIDLSVGGLPSGATGAFAQAGIAGAGTSSLSVTTTAATPPGSYPVTITGTSGAASHSASVTLVVNPAPDFSVSASPPSQTVVAGDATSYPVTTSAVGGFNGSIDLSVSGLPSGASGAFAPANVLSADTSSLSVTTTAATPAGSYPVTITGTSGALSHTASVTLVVNPAPDFSVSASPPSQTVVAGAGTSYPVATSTVGGFSGSIDLSVTGLPSGAGGVFAQAGIAGAGTSSLSVTTGAATPPGSYPLTITGTSGTLTRSASVTLVVNPAGPGFTLSISPSTQSARRGTSVSYNVTVTPTGGFTGTVRLKLSVAPSGPSGSFHPIYLKGGTSKLTVNARRTLGTFTLTVTGTSNGITRSSPIRLSVTS
jgi:uncharacterized membrane protein